MTPVLKAGAWLQSEFCGEIQLCMEFPGPFKNRTSAVDTPQLETKKREVR